MPLKLLTCDGGHLVLPDRASLLAGAADGGNLVVLPPQPVWERSELSVDELRDWAFLVAAAGRAMLDVLPQLAGGCINYWEAGNWALNDDAEPKGRKLARDHRSVHLHLLGRSPTSTNPNWHWGESPRFPEYAQRQTWSRDYDRLAPEACRAIVDATITRLRDVYAMTDAQIAGGGVCTGCGYPLVPTPATNAGRCEECQASK